MNLNIKSIAIILPFLLLGIIFGRYWSVSGMFSHHMQEHGHEGEMGDRDTFVGMKDDMIGEMIADGNYKCCLEKPCTYCIEKTPGHGEGATCLCLEDIMNGVILVENVLERFWKDMVTGLYLSILRVQLPRRLVRNT